MKRHSTHTTRSEPRETQERIDRFNEVPMKRRDYVTLVVVLLIMLALFAASAYVLIWIGETYFWKPDFDV